MLGFPERSDRSRQTSWSTCANSGGGVSCPGALGTPLPRPAVAELRRGARVGEGAAAELGPLWGRPTHVRAEDRAARRAATQPPR